MIGVSYNDFWELNPNTLEPFIKAYSLKEKSFDRLMWQMGIYIRTAIGSCLDSKNIKYPNKPFSQIDVMEDMKARFMRDAERINQTLRNKKEVK